MLDKEQKLLARVLDLFAQRFDQNAVLRGGMVLRVLGSPRLTNDLDYVFVPYTSKKEIVDDVLVCLHSIDGAHIEHSLNSKCLRVVLTVDGTRIQVESTVAVDVESDTTSTRMFSQQFDLPPRLIHIMELSVALSNKLAAWNERRLIRDLYDVWFLLQMSVTPDHATLAERLKNPNYSPLVDSDDYYAGDSPPDFYDFIRAKVATYTDDDIHDGLSDYLTDEEIVGLLLQFKAALARLR